MWSDHSRLKSEVPVKETRMNVLKSPLGNYFLLEEPEPTTSDSESLKQKPTRINLATDEHQAKTSDFGQLQVISVHGNKKSNIINIFVELGRFH